MMDPGGMTVFSLLKARLGMLGARQRVIAENVANVSTPDYSPRDVDAAAFSRQLERAVTLASRPGGAPPAAGGPGAARLTGTGGQARAEVRVIGSPDSETTLDGNSVVVEEQMMKLTETRMEFETMVGLYQKSLILLRLAARSPTR